MTRPIDHAPCGLLTVDDGGVICDANQAIADALGMAPEALRGRKVREILAPGARLYYQTHFFPLLRLRGAVHEVYVSFRTAAGDDLPVLVEAARHEGSDGPMNWLAVVPIERRSRFEDEILEARRAAETASDSRARFLAMLSHDIRSPLSAMTFSADMMALQALGPVTDAQAAELARIAEAGRYVLRLVADVLAFSRLETDRVDVRPARLDVAAAVEAALALVRAQAEGAGVTLAPPAGPPAEAWADADRLRQVLVNLLGNAVKFTGAEGPGTVAVAWEVADGRVALRVADTGPGIAADRLDAVFAPFVQEGGLGAASGVGLGLSISRELARAMGGEVTVESALGEGATFTVDLPLAPPEGG
ncbi:ATP-binding protein [Rubrivirga sp. IMCC45206]|uniref:sensor histidine kinase n=1 Tax=Rubrivirga sp. IMCC45206 TaxID=3391614 RepID=UPI00398F96C9